MAKIEPTKADVADVLSVHTPVRSPVESHVTVRSVGTEPSSGFIHHAGVTHSPGGAMLHDPGYTVGPHDTAIGRLPGKVDTGAVEQPVRQPPAR